MSKATEHIGEWGQPATVADETVSRHDDKPLRPPATADVLVLDARLGQSLAAVRSLGRRGLRVAAMGSSLRPPLLALDSRWCQQAFTCPVEEGSDAFLPYLEAVLAQTAVPVLMAGSEGTLALLRRYRDRLERQACLALAKEPALAIATSKTRTLEVASQLGMHVPRAALVESATDVPAALREIGLPAVVKPVRSWAQGEDQDQGVYVQSSLVTTPDEAQRAVEALERVGMSALFQEFLSGNREVVTFFYANGQIHASWAQWSKRSLPPLGGQAVMRQSIAVPDDMGEPAERLVREIDLEGIASVEFRRDSRGVPYLMEINPRLWASVELAIRSGVDFPYLLYQWAHGEKIDVVKSYHVGGWLRDVQGDLLTTVKAVQQRGRPGIAPPAKAIAAFCGAFFTPAAYDSLDWNDPRPAWLSLASFARQGLRAVGKRKGGQNHQQRMGASTMDSATVSHHREQDHVNGYFQSQATYWKDLYSHDGVKAEVHRDRFTTTLHWIDDLGLEPGSHVLEIGCGAGFLTAALVERGFRVEAIDAAQAMVDQTRQLLVESGRAEQVSLQVGDVQELAFADQSFNLVVALGVIPWLPRPDLALREMARVARPGGYVVLTADNRNRLITALDPWNHPALTPLRKRVKVALGQIGLRRAVPDAEQRIIVTYHRPRFIDEGLNAVHLTRLRGKTLGFGPFTLLSRSLVPRPLAIPLHRRLQRLADRGVPPFRSTGAQYLVLARKADLSPRA